MAETFTSIKIEAYINGAWADLTPDVRTNPPPRVSGMGIMSNQFTDRVGDAGTFTFTLDNSVANSGGVNGYYTPFSSTVRTGWRPGVPVRLYFVYDSYTRYKFYGYIDTDGIDATAGTKGERSVSVRASNWMKYASEQKMSLLYRQTNYDIYNSVQDILDRSGRKPLNVYWFGINTRGTKFPTVFDTVNADTKATSEFQKLAMSEFGYVYIAGDDSGGERLVVEAYTDGRRSSNDPAMSGDGLQGSQGSWVPVKTADITDAILLEDGTNILLEDSTNLLMDNSQRASFAATDISAMDVSYGKNMFNKVKFKIYPRTVDSSAVTLSTLEKAIPINAGETLTDIRNSYKDPNNQAVNVSGFDMVAPVATTDYQMFANSDGTGTDYTANLTVTAEYGAGEVKYTLASAAVANAYVTKLNARGKGVYLYDTVDKVYENSTSITNYGALPKDIDLPYVSQMSDLWLNADKTSGIWSLLLNTYALTDLSVDSVTFDVNRSSKLMMAFMFLEPGFGYLKVADTMTNTAGGGYTYYTNAFSLMGYDLEIIQGKFVRWTCVLKGLDIR